MSVESWPDSLHVEISQHWASRGPTRGKRGWGQKTTRAVSGTIEISSSLSPDCDYNSAGDPEQPGASTTGQAVWLASLLLLVMGSYGHTARQAPRFPSG